MNLDFFGFTFLRYIIGIYWNHWSLRFMNKYDFARQIWSKTWEAFSLVHWVEVKVLVVGLELNVLPV